MTQTLTHLYQVQGKDRMSDAWTTYVSRFAWQANQWADSRAFVVRNADGSPCIYPTVLFSRVCLEWMTNGGWKQYTAWEAPDAIYGLIERARTETTQRFRVVLEDDPAMVVAV